MNRWTGVGAVLLMLLAVAYALAPNPELELLPPEWAPIAVVHVIRPEPIGKQEREEGERILRVFRAHWNADRTRHRGSDVYDDVLFEGQPYQPELRLWARGYPSVASAWAQKALARTDYLGEDAGWALEAMVELAVAGYPGAAAEVLRICQDPAWREDVPHALLRAGLYAEQVPLLRRLAWSGIEDAWEVLSYLPLEVEGAASLRARRAMARAKGLRDGTWEVLARSALLGEDPFPDEELRWALHVARERRAPWLLALLRQRLSAVRSDVWTLPRCSSERSDRMLLTLAELGEPLSLAERYDLRRHGFGCEPRTGLAGVLREKGY